MFVIFLSALDVCELASVPLNSGLQGHVLTGDSWGLFPLIPLLYSFLHYHMCDGSCEDSQETSPCFLPVLSFGKCRDWGGEFYL